MRRLLLLATIIGALFTAGAASGRVPGFGTEDVCACGGQINYVYSYQQTLPPNWRDCFYDGYAPNGSYVNTIAVRKSIVQTCGPTP